MVDVEGILAIVFITILTLLIVRYRKKWNIQKILFPVLYVGMYRTKWGIKWMQKTADKFGKVIRFLGYLGVVIGFAGMALIAFELIRNTFALFLQPSAPQAVGLVLPFKVKGAFFVPFSYWIVSIFIIAVVHEFSHGIVAKAHGIKIKSSGFAFLAFILPIIPAAFVEPDEKMLAKAKIKKQLSVFAAGPFSNILLAFILLGIATVAVPPIAAGLNDFDGVMLSNVLDDLPAATAGIEIGEKITGVDGAAISTVKNFTQALKDKSPGQQVRITTDKGEYEVTLTENPTNKSKPYLGVIIEQSARIKPAVEDKYGAFLPQMAKWSIGLLFILVILNLGIGLFNLVPVGPIDGGRMLHVVLHKYLKKELAAKIFSFISFTFLILIIILIGSAFVG